MTPSLAGSPLLTTTQAICSPTCPRYTPLRFINILHAFPAVSAGNGHRTRGLSSYSNFRPTVRDLCPPLRPYKELVYLPTPVPLQVVQLATPKNTQLVFEIRRACIALKRKLPLPARRDRFQYYRACASC